MENKNTFYYKKNIIISWEKIDFVPEIGDELNFKEDKFMAVGDFAEFAEAEPGKEFFVTDDFNTEAAGENNWKICRPIEFGGKKYGLIGCRTKGHGDFFLYELV